MENIRITETGFDLLVGAKVKPKGSVVWNRINSITAIKIAQFDGEILGLEFEVPGEKQFFLVTDEVGGFDDLCNRLEMMFAVDTTWRSRLSNAEAGIPEILWKTKTGQSEGANVSRSQ